jgi:hypothetical protein
MVYALAETFAALSSDADGSESRLGELPPGIALANRETDSLCAVGKKCV